MINLPVDIIEVHILIGLQDSLPVYCFPTWRSVISIAPQQAQINVSLCRL
ncbi:hypothetical protein GMES_1304 [Paraglaciecola mesophila KMM 241]|uniref:Uncharacterized protein n=1 Tax=Paraglaciecola mesophila KMM 241 TaxID=1128912 RepID=K6Z3M1_9ALTE|nr:hypothetical protein GMES_1304 [Paraglaciecola mesophila KMM 241]